MERRQFLATCTSLATAAITGCDKTPGSLWVPRTGLDFPGSHGVTKTMRFRFLNPLAIYPATYIWRAYPRRQAGYYTAFFWGNDDGKGDLRTFLWTPDNDADSYYGAHPYPQPRPLGTDHRWEISIVREDILGDFVKYDGWFTQALRVWSSPFGKHHEFYWNLPFTNKQHSISYSAPSSWGNRLPPVPALTWGDAPWAPGKEVWSGILSGIQVYETCLSIREILSEAAVSRSTDAGAASIWYENLNPHPDDIADRSGRGHHPEWVGPERPRLWTGQ
jgi:hypothetical protein